MDIMHIWTPEKNWVDLNRIWMVNGYNVIFKHLKS